MFSSGEVILDSPIEGRLGEAIVSIQTFKPNFVQRAILYPWLRNVPAEKLFYLKTRGEVPDDILVWLEKRASNVSRASGVGDDIDPDKNGFDVDFRLAHCIEHVAGVAIPRSEKNRGQNREWAQTTNLDGKGVVFWFDKRVATLEQQTEAIKSVLNEASMRTARF